jgi:hypothetical protein
MEKAPEHSGREIPFREAESGMMVGLWHTPVDGFEWRDDLRPAFADGKVKVKDPPKRSWWLVERGDVGKRYPVLARPNLARDFARLGVDPTRPAILAFARRYGRLGDSTLLVQRGRKMPHRIALAMGGGSGQWGESLELWQREALKFRLLWETWELVILASGRRIATKGQIDRARRSLADRFGWNEDGSIWYRFEVAGAGAMERGAGLITDPDRRDHGAIADNIPRDDLAAAARYWVIQRVNEQMRGRVNPTILPLRNAEVRFAPENLRAALYLRLAMEISEGLGQMRECAGCSQPFTPSRRDQIFCGKNCRERASYRRRAGGSRSERDLLGSAASSSES